VVSAEWGLKQKCGIWDMVKHARYDREYTEICRNQGAKVVRHCYNQIPSIPAAVWTDQTIKSNK